MAIALVQSKFVQALDTTSYDVAPTEGNLLVACSIQRNAFGSVILPPGWTDSGYGIITSGGNVRELAVAYKEATGAEGAILFDWPSTSQAIFVSEWSGVQLTPEDSSMFENGYWENPKNPGNVDVAADALILTFIVYDHDAGGVVTPNAGTTELVDNNHSGGFSPSLWVGYRIEGSGGSYGAYWDSVGGNGWGGTTLAFAEATTGGGSASAVAPVIGVV